jgi:uncharacterized paraquat-inducible protein A
MRTISQTLRDKTMSNRSKQFVATCPFCGHAIVSNAIVCLRCRRDLRSGRRLDDLEKNSFPHSRGWVGLALLATVLVVLAYFIWIKGTPSDPFFVEKAAVVAPAPETVSNTSPPAVQKPQAEPAPKIVQRPAVPAASTKSVRTKVVCPECTGLGYKLSSFGHDKRKCLRCQGTGFVMRTVTVSP